MRSTPDKECGEKRPRPRDFVASVKCIGYRVVLSMMNPRVLGDLIDRHGPALVLFARQWCDAPEDAVQEAFLRLIRERTLPAEPVAWLFRVVRNVALDASKGKSRRQRREAIVGKRECWFEEEPRLGSDQEAAVQALQALPPEQRECIVAHLWGGLTFEQIGRVAGESASTAHRRFSAGLQALRTQLGISSPGEVP